MQRPRDHLGQGRQHDPDPQGLRRLGGLGGAAGQPVQAELPGHQHAPLVHEQVEGVGAGQLLGERSPGDAAVDALPHAERPHGEQGAGSAQRAQLGGAHQRVAAHRVVALAQVVAAQDPAAGHEPHAALEVRVGLDVVDRHTVEIAERGEALALEGHQQPVVVADEHQPTDDGDGVHLGGPQAALAQAVGAAAFRGPQPVGAADVERAPRGAQEGPSAGRPLDALPAAPHVQALPQTVRPAGEDAPGPQGIDPQAPRGLRRGGLDPVLGIEDRDVASDVGDLVREVGHVGVDVEGLAIGHVAVVVGLLDLHQVVDGALGVEQQRLFVDLDLVPGASGQHHPPREAVLAAVDGAVGVHGEQPAGPGQDHRGRRAIEAQLDPAVVVGPAHGRRLGCGRQQIGPDGRCGRSRIVGRGGRPSVVVLGRRREAEEQAEQDDPRGDGRPSGPRLRALDGQCCSGRGGGYDTHRARATAGELCTQGSRERPLQVFEAARRAVEGGRACALVTVVGIGGSAPRKSGARMLVHADGTIVGTVGGGVFEHRCIAEALAAIAAGQPRRYAVHLTRDLGMCCGGEMDAYIEPLESRPDLVIHGAGHVGAAVARLAVPLGFRVTVVDDRDDLLAQAVLPDGVERLERDPRRALASLPTGPLAWHLVVTHDHALDQDLVQALLPQPLAWLGMIGSRTKVARFLLRLKAAGMDERLFSRLRAPVGLDLSAETPEEIAISIAAELVAVRRGHRGATGALSEIPLPARGGDGRATSLRDDAGDEPQSGSR
ncbi:MAG: xanthine dehydrogenase accessory protein XdhC [Alphaproteobacteria bacterium]|nr:xanthine dehydrogenase accessory protein XdhC [Alphaproteobacteria bacterium]